MHQFTTCPVLSLALRESFLIGPSGGKPPCKEIAAAKDLINDSLFNTVAMIVCIGQRLSYN